MSSYSTTLFQRNLSNFNALLKIVECLNEQWRPSGQDLFKDALNTLYSDSEKSFLEYRKILPSISPAILNRKHAFSNIHALVTRIRNYYLSLQHTEENLKNVLSLIKKINPPANEQINGNLSYESIAINFENLYNFLKDDDVYAKISIQDLTLSALECKLSEIKSANLSVASIFETEEKLNIELKCIMNNIFIIAKRCKKYIYSIHGLKSEICKTAAQLKFVQF